MAVGGFSTSSTLLGAANITGISLETAKEDLGFKIERLISAVNLLQTNQSAIQVALQSAAATLDGASLFSAFSAGGTGTLTAISNFTA